MSKFEEFMKSQPQQTKPVGEAVDGDFWCQSCDLSAEEAEYFRMQSVLKWTCPDGHVSYIEDFRL